MMNKVELRAKYRPSKHTVIDTYDLRKIIKGRKIGFYYPVFFEVDVKKAMKNLISFYSVYLPFTDLNGMEYRKVESFGKYDKDYYKINSGTGETININDLDTIIVPAIAYNTKGYRLGYGKGYYDKALAGYSGNIIGICNDNSFIEEEFQEQHDLKANYVITNKGLKRLEE